MFDGVLFLVGWCCGGWLYMVLYFWLCVVPVAGWWAWCFWFVRLLLGLVLMDVGAWVCCFVGFGVCFGLLVGWVILIWLIVF